MGHIFFFNFTFYCFLIDNLHTSCSCLHNKYICIQFDHAKEFFSFNYTIHQQCGTIYVIKQRTQKQLFVQICALVVLICICLQTIVRFGSGSSCSRQLWIGSTSD